MVYLYREQEVPLMTYLRTAPDFNTPLDMFIKVLGEVNTVKMKLQTRQIAGNQAQRKTRVLLAWQAVVSEASGDGNVHRM